MANPWKRKEIIDFMRQAADRHGVPAATVLGHSKLNEITLARWEGWADAHAAGYAFAAIGRVTGFHHTSVMHGVRRHNERKAK